jgi:flagellar assembly protein FliH
MPAPESRGPADQRTRVAANGGSPAGSLWANMQGSGKLRTFSEEEVQTRIRVLEAKQRESEEKLRNEYEAALVRERATVAEALHQFDRQRKSYFERVEAEVVQLSLAVARKILHREAQTDPLVLTGTIRVALEKVAAGSRVKLLVPEHDVFKWRQVMGTLKNVQPQAEVIADPALAPGSCILETEVGRSQISLDHQFREIERGLLDLLAVRTAS